MVVAATAAAALFLTVGSAPALADDTSAGRDVDGVYPIQSTDVEMVAESVTIDLFNPEGETGLPGIYSKVRCQFVFHNNSARPLDVLMAFPAEAAPMGDSPTEGLAVRGFQAFVQTAGGQGQAPGAEEELPVTLEPASAGPREMAGSTPGFSSWYTFTASFGPGETRTVVNTYWVQNTYNSIGEVWVRYVLETGRNWIGPIGDATVTLNLGEIRPEYVDNLYPGNWRFAPDGKSLTWHRVNFEPAYNLAVRYNIRAWDGHGDTRPERRAELEKLMAEAPGLSQAALLEALKEAIAAEAAMVRAFLPEAAVPEGPPVVTDISVTTPAPPVVPILKVSYADPDGDLAALYVRVSHEDRGQTVVDWDLSGSEAWVYEGRSSGVYEMSLGDQPTYRVEVTLEDAAGLKATKSATLTIPPGGGSGQGTEGGGPGTSQDDTRDSRPSRLAWIVAAATLAVAAIAGALLARRSRRARRPSRPA